MTKDLTCTSWLHFIHFAYGICPLVYAALSIGSCNHVCSHWYTHIDVPKFLKLLVFPVPYVVCIVLPTLLNSCWKECQHKALHTYDTIMEWFSQRLIDKGSKWMKVLWKKSGCPVSHSWCPRSQQEKCKWWKKKENVMTGWELDLFSFSCMVQCKFDWSAKYSWSLLPFITQLDQKVSENGWAHFVGMGSRACAM